ncbi:MAG: DUF4340 domain-containing protein [Desulfatiglans sp.]|jgi:hypothetical protein|nr:DUF4340 domain-containing protein [Desulfatiglans sp.]
MKMKKEYLILILVIAALAIYISLRKESRIQYEIPEVSEIASEEISGILISGDGKEFKIKKENDKWLIGSENYPADSYKIGQMVDFLKRPLLMTVVSDSEDYLRYGLDEKKRIMVKAISGEKELRIVDIGNPAGVQNYTFIRIGDDPVVYHAREDLRDIFVPDVDEIRDKKVIAFNRDDVESVSFKGDGKDWVFTRKAQPQGEGNDKNGELFQWESEDGIKAEHAKMISILDEIASIKCFKYIYDEASEELDSPLYVVRVRDKTDHILTVYPKKEDDYRAQSSDNPSPFYLYAWRIDNIREKFEDIIGVNNEEKPDA